MIRILAEIRRVVKFVPVDLPTLGHGPEHFPVTGFGRVLQLPSVGPDGHLKLVKGYNFYMTMPGAPISISMLPTEANAEHVVSLRLSQLNTRLVTRLCS